MQSRQKSPLYSLQVVAERLGMSPRTIRLYEQAGLIQPARTGGKRQRLYSDQDITWLRCIHDMIHGEGLTVASIRRLLDFAPCWEIRQCATEVAQSCRPDLNIPDVGRHRSSSDTSAVSDPSEENADTQKAWC